MNFDPATDWTTYSGDVICEGCESFIPVDHAIPVPVEWERGEVARFAPFCEVCERNGSAEDAAERRAEAGREAREDFFMERGVW